VIKVGISARFPNLSASELRALVAEAHSARVRVTAHVEDTAGARTALATGVDELAHMPALDVDRAVMRRVARAGIEIVGTLHVGSRFPLAAPNVLANARAFVAAGGMLLYGSDYGNPGIPLGVDGDELRLMNLAGLSNLDVLRNATSRSGAVLGLRGVGRLVAGGPADLAVVKGNVASSLGRVSALPLLVVVRGTTVVDGDRLNAPEPC
jgi:imidazolonepropionase-like amidohydrolase